MNDVTARHCDRRQAGCHAQEIQCQDDLPQKDDQHHDGRAAPPAEYPCDRIMSQRVFPQQKDEDLRDVQQDEPKEFGMKNTVGDCKNNSEENQETGKQIQNIAAPHEPQALHGAANDVLVGTGAPAFRDHLVDETAAKDIGRDERKRDQDRKRHDRSERDKQRSGEKDDIHDDRRPHQLPERSVAQAELEKEEYMIRAAHFACRRIRLVIVQIHGFGSFHEAAEIKFVSQRPNIS